MAGQMPMGIEAPTTTDAQPKGIGVTTGVGIGTLGEDEQPDWNIPTVDKQTFVDEFHGGGAPFTKTGKLAAGKANDIVATAEAYVGTPYVWGGNGMEGIDCSGLVQQVYRSMGIELPRLSADQARAGQRIDMKDLQPGDLVAWDNSTRNEGADHIAIYAGNGMITEAPRPGLNVRTRKLDADDYNGWGVRLQRGN